MPTELISLNEQLLNLKVIYENAVLGNSPLEHIKKVGDQMKEIEKAIEKKKEFLGEKESE